ncbi:MAG: MFS transporter [Nevskiaceae bacterium]|nr:MAG: MFS transporter [Nevskiaceae bacterium]TBR73186.1 MAG: MFS transporter [Nevskiaceae bacterium]
MTLAALLLLAMNLRLIYPSLAVLLPDIGAALGLSPAAQGYVTTLPVLCMGLFAPLAPLLARRFGVERTVVGLLVLLALGTGLRGAFGVPGLFFGTALAGAAIAVANVLLPALVKRDFGGHVPLVTSLYSMMMNVGAAIAAAATVPLAYVVTGHWTAALALWAIPALLVAGVWGARVRHHAAPAPAPRQTTGGPRLWRDPLAWQVTILMGSQSGLAYCAAGWIAPILRHRGMEAVLAGGVMSVNMMLVVVGSLLAPLLVRQLRDQRRLNVALSLLSGVPLLGFLFAPLSTAWWWAAVQGIGSGAVFTTALTVIVLRSRDTAVAARLSSMAQTVGYVIAAMGPLCVGLLLDWTGGIAAAGGVFVALTLSAALAGWGAGRARYVNA